MDKVNIVIKFIQDNWGTLLIILLGILALLRAYAHFKINWAKATPEPEDDIEAEITEKKVNAIMQFIKDLFKISDDKDEPKN